MPQAMFEYVVANLIAKYGEKYVASAIEPENIAVGLNHITLSNVSLNTAWLNEFLASSVRVKRLSIKRLVFRVPWFNLFEEHVRLEANGVFVVLTAPSLRKPTRARRDTHNREEKSSPRAHDSSESEFGYSDDLDSAGDLDDRCVSFCRLVLSALFFMCFGCVFVVLIRIWTMRATTIKATATNKQTQTQTTLFCTRKRTTLALRQHLQSR